MYQTWMLWDCFFCKIISLETGPHTGLTKKNSSHWRLVQADSGLVRSSEKNMDGGNTPLKFNMVHLNINPWKRRFRTWKPSFSGAMLNFGVVSEYP